MGPSVRLLLALLAAPLCPAMAQGAAGAPSLEVAGTLFRVTMPDGRIITSSDLIGAVVEAADERGQTLTVRIDAVSRDPSDADGDLWLHRLSLLDAASGAWRPLCAAGPDGSIGGFPLAGSWTADGRHLRGSSGFTITCTGGAIGKCVRFGYKPWRDLDGQSLWDYHQACVRMVRADYGGDGIGHTRDGTLIDIFDRLGLQRLESDTPDRPLEFEAAWGPAGAVCVRRTRIPEVLSVAELVERYPRLVGSIGPDCSEAVAALIWNRS